MFDPDDLTIPEIIEALVGVHPIDMIKTVLDYQSRPKRDTQKELYLLACIGGSLLESLERSLDSISAGKPLILYFVEPKGIVQKKTKSKGRK